MKGIWIAAFCILFSPVLKSAPIEIKVDAGRYDREVGTLVSAEIVGIPKGARAAMLEPEGGLAQVIAGPKDQIVWRLNAPLAAGESIRYSVKPVKADGMMGCTETDAAIELQQTGAPILRFIKKPTPEEADHEAFYTRTGYIHPLWTPQGKVVTGDYPADHVHQHALFFAWTKTQFEGRPTEFWNQKLEKGTVRFLKATGATGGVAFAGFSAENLYEDQSAPGGPKAVLKENWVVRSWYRADGEKFRIVDIEIDQRCAGESPLVIEKYHYGGMAIRGTSEWLPASKKEAPPANFLTSEKLTRSDGNHSRPEWVSMNGPLNGGHASVTIMAHPSNFRHPQAVRLHPSKPYFVFTPMVDEGFEITPEKPYWAKFRIIIEDGEVIPGKLDRFYQNFAEPPTAVQL
ncbi:MAG: PmoA family protein [Verrucomicrobiales bacterium]|nr:PmoA family protein [Verrucomicrobiales bacterium]